jgi:hypothetical protein
VVNFKDSTQNTVAKPSLMGNTELRTKRKFQCKKLLNCDVKTADSFACVFLYEKNENFFDNRNFRPIISAFKDLLLGVIMTAKGLAPLWAHLGEA